MNPADIIQLIQTAIPDAIVNPMAKAVALKSPSSVPNLRVKPCCSNTKG